MDATLSIGQLQQDARRLQLALRDTAPATPGFNLLGQQLQQKLTAISEAQQQLFNYGNNLAR